MVIGGSGSGKSVLIKHTLVDISAELWTGVSVFGNDLASLDGRSKRQLQLKIGMLFERRSVRLHVCARKRPAAG